jgi:hypothetical protein
MLGKKNKKAIEIGELILWLIAIGSLVLIFVVLIFVKSGGESLIKKIIGMLLGRG